MTERQKLPEALLERINSITNRRARVVPDALVKKGSVSTTELQAAGYDHPPRAARDVVELGIALKRVTIKRKDGQRIASYVFDERELDPSKTGRVVLAKKEREAIIERNGSKCGFCGCKSNLQVDHKIPYEVAGESPNGTRTIRTRFSTDRATARNHGTASTARTGRESKT